MPDCVHVLVDQAERLGELSYICEAPVQIGDAVEVPFGSRVKRGIVTGVGDQEKATRSVLRVYGQRSSPSLVRIARSVASSNLCDFTTVVKRLGPTTKRGNPPLDSGPVLVRDGTTFDDIGRDSTDSAIPRRIVAVAPSVSQTRLAALEAQELSSGGQVLVLCPTKEMVTQVLAEFESGAGRLDRVPKGDDPSAWAGLLAGTVQIGVGTRAAALWAVKALAGIVVVDEDHPGHREMSMPYTSARDVAAKRTRVEDANLVLLSSNPSPSGLGSDVKLSVVGATWPETVVLSRSSRRRYLPELPRGLPALLEEARARSADILIVAGGVKSKRRCLACKAVWKCEECGSGSCVHTAEACPTCGSEDTLITGWDVAKTSRVSGETAASPSALRGHKSCDLVVLFDVDPWLGVAELVPGRAAADLILEAGRKVRRGGRLVLVTCEPHDELLELLVKGDLRGISKRTWTAAKNGGLPPFGRQVTLSGTGRPPNTLGWPGRVLGPRTIENGSWEIVILCRSGQLAELSPVLARLRRRGRTRVTVL
jgi:primosomal protein N'